MKKTSLTPDPVIELYKKDIDRTLLRENLKRTVTERFERLMELQQFAEELQRAGREVKVTKGEKKMGHARLHGDEIERRGIEVYQREIRTLVETEENIGKICAIDVETGDYHIADDVLEAAAPLHAKHPDAAVWGERIGYNALYALSGFAELQRTAK